MLVIISPAGPEKMFEELGTEILNGHYDRNITQYSAPSIEEKKRLLGISKKYGVQILE